MLLVGPAPFAPAGSLQSEREGEGREGELVGGRERDKERKRDTERDREGQRERKRERERERETDYLILLQQASRNRRCTGDEMHTHTHTRTHTHTHTPTHARTHARTQWHVSGADSKNTSVGRNWMYKV